MDAVCPAPGPDDPMVQSLLGVVDCNVRALVHTGYGAIFQPGAAIAGVLTAILTIYVAIIGYRLLLGQAQLRVSDFALNAVKLGIVIVLATQWDTYQTVVYEVLFHGPEQLAGMMVGAVHPESGLVHGDVFDGLQRTFDDLSGFGDAYAAHAPAAPIGRLWLRCILADRLGDHPPLVEPGRSFGGEDRVGPLAGGWAIVHRATLVREHARGV
jgi:type IV secretion system protein VirB6